MGHIQQQGAHRGLAGLRDGRAGWEHSGETQGAKGSEQTLPWAEPLELPRSHSRAGAADRRANTASILPASILRALTAARGKPSGKCQSGVLIAQVQWGGAFAARSVSNQAGAHEISTCISVSLGKECWKALPFAYNHHVLRTNHSGFPQERAPNEQSQWGFRLLLSPGTGLVELTIPRAGTSSGGAGQ